MILNKILDLHRKAGIVTTDSREIKNDCLFFALKGENFDANQFAASALEKGAIAAIVDDPSVVADDRYILVDNVLNTLQQLAQSYREQFDIPVVAITGTNGKTTTKELVTAVLSKKYTVSATHGNLNNHIGLPLSILNARKNSEIIVVELGANHIGEIAQLCSIANPTHGLITNVGTAHLEGFGSFEGIVTAKTELYAYLQGKDNTVIIYNDDDKLLKAEAEKYKTEKLRYGNNQNCDLPGTLIEAAPFANVICKLKEKQFEIQTKLIGDYNLYNILAAAAVGTLFDIEPQGIVDAISDYQPSNNRSQFVETEKNRIILDAYNANPSSMEMAINNFEDTGFINRMVVFGDMLELGNFSHEHHEAVYNMIIKKDWDAVFIGPNYSKVVDDKKWPCFTNTKEAIEFFKEQAFENKTILIKGSRGIGVEAVLEYL